MIQNYNSSFNGTRLLRTLKPDRGGTRTRLASRIAKNCNVQLILFLFMLLGVMQSSFAQTNISGYSFATTTGATYTPITGGTVLGTSYDSNIYSAVPLGGTFTFGGSSFTTCYVSSNGFIGFGTAVSSSTYTVLTSTVTGSSGIIAAFAQDGANSTATGASSEIRYQTIGNEFIVQFKDHANYYNRTTEKLNFQIRLDLTTGNINIVYGTCTDPGSSTTQSTPQVGIRGNSTAYASNVNGLYILNIPTGTTCDWSKAVSAYSNASTMLFSSGTNVNVKIPTGLTYTWTPGTQLPVRTFTAATSVGGTTATLAWTAPTGATSYNVQYRVPGTCDWTNWSGNPVATNSVTLTGLTGSTSYQVRVQANNGTALSPYSHIPTGANNDGYTTTGTFTTTPTAPYITASTLTAFSNICTGVTAGPNSFTVSGGNLTTDVTVGALSGYTYSATSGGTYTSTLTLTPTSGSLSAVPVYVKFSPVSVASYSGNIALTSTGATTVNVAASGSGVNTIPTAGSAGTVGSITTSGASISAAAISANGCSAVTAYGIEYSTTSGFTGGTGTQVAGTGYAGTGSGTLSATLAGLAANTTYYYKVYATNNGGTAYGTQGSFLTLCNAIPSSSLPWTESFDTNSTTINCWSIVSGSGAQAGDKWAYTTSDATHGVTGPSSSTRFAYLDVYNCEVAGNTYNLISPAIVLPASAKRLKYQYYLGNGGYTTTPVPLAVEISVNGGAYTSIYSHTTSNSTFASTTAVTNWKENWIDLTPYVNKTVQFRFVSNSNYGSNYCNQGLDQVTVEDLPACVQPGIPVASAVVYNGATITWTAPSTGTTPTGYEYAVLTSATPPASGTSITGLTTSVSGLTGNTAYYIHVRTNCGSGNYSSWSTSSAFTTPCTPVVPTYTNDFATFPGTCWNAALSGGTPATGPSGTTAYWIADGFLNSGTTGAVSMNLYSLNRAGWLKSAPLNLSAGGYRVKFNYGVTAYDSTSSATTTATDDTVQFLVSNDGGNTWTVLQTWNSPNSNITNTSNTYSYNLTSYTGSNTVFAFYGSDGPVDDTPDYDFSIDNFTVEAIPNTGLGGDYNTAANWSKGAVPLCGEYAEIPSGITMTMSSGSAAVGTLAIVGGTLSVTGGTLTVGSCTGNTGSLQNGGTINVSGGTLVVNGNIANASGSTFIQSAGNITIDGNNNNTTASSVASGTPLLAFGTSATSFATGTVTLSGGTLTIVDPHTATTNTSGYALYGNFASGVTFTASPNHTLQFGDGTSTQAGGTTSGFYHNLFAGSGRLNLGSVTVNNPGAIASRIVTQATTTGLTGNLAITAGTYSQGASTTYVGGNITVENGAMYLANGTTYFALISGATINAQTVAQSVTVNGTGTIQNLATNPTGNFDSVTFKNTSATGVTINPLNQVVANAAVAANVRNNLTFDGKVSTTGGKTLLYGTLTTYGSGSVTVTSGGMVPGSAYGRGWNANQTGTAINSGAVPTTANSQFPLLDENGNSRYTWIERVSPTDAGIISIKYTAGSGTSPVSITDGAYTVDTRSNGKWTVSILGTDMAATTYKMAVNGTTIFGSSPATAVARIITDSAAIGTFQAGTTLPNAQRTDLTLAMLTGQDFYMGINSNDVPFLSVQNGNWNDATTWNKGTVPTATDIVTVSTGHTVTVDNTVSATAAVASTLTVNAGGTLAVSANALTVTNAITTAATAAINATGGTLGATTIANSGTVTVSGATINVTGASGTGINNPSGAVFTLNSGTVNIGAAGGNDRRFTNVGTLTVAGGTLNINGNLAHSGTAFNHSGGNINLDPNAAGVTANSTTSSNYTLNLTAPVNWTGGTITLVDPPASTSGSHYSVYYSNSTASEVSASHTLRFGDAVSSTAGGNAIGFYVYNSTGRLNAGNVVVNGPATGTATATNRIVKLNSGFGVKGNFTLQNAAEFAHPSVELIVAGNISIDATSKYTANGTLTLALPSGTTSAVNTAAQTITNLGTIENVAGSATANLTSFTINNSNATGVTLNSPLTMSGTLTLTSGKVNTTSVNLLTLGTATLAGTLNNVGSATAYINGPFARTFPASRTASGSYGVATTFPVGNSGGYQSINIDPTTTAGGAVTFVAQAFTTNSGTQGTGVTSLSPHRWETSITSGAANFTNTFIRLRDDSIAATNKIVQSSSAAGEYAPTTSVSNYATGMLTTATALVGTDYKGYFAFGDLNPCTMPADQATSFVASSITTTTFTANYTAAASAPSHYLVVRYDITAGAATVTNPVDYTVYAASAALGTGTVVYNGAGLTFNQTGLTAGNTYQYYVYSYNNTGCYGPVYNTTSPLVQSVTTCAAATGTTGTPTVATTPAATATSFRAQWSASSTAGATYLIDVATNTGFTTFVSGYQNLAVSDVYKDISGLTANTTYYVRVRAISGYCVSANSSTLTFTTPCVAADAPISLDFSAGTIPSCWKNASASTNSYDQWQFTGGPDYEADLNGRADGTFAWVDGSSTTTSDVTFLSPSINLATLTVPELSFDYFSNATADTNSTFKVDVFNGTSWVNIYTNNTDDVNWRTLVLSLSAYAGTTIQIRFVVDKSTSSTAYNNDILLDNVSIHETPSCIMPDNVAVSLSSTTSANFSWNAPATGTTPVGYEYAVSTSATPPASGTATTSTSVSAVAVTANTNYYLYVRTNCGGGSYSTWKSVPFYTNYCLTGSNYTGYEYIYSFSTTGGYTNITNNATGGPAYSDYTLMSVSQSLGNTVDYLINVEDYYEDGTGLAMFIDWNNDLDFNDANETVYTSNGYVSYDEDITGTITIPAGTPNGSYRMRLRTDYYSANPSACGTVDYSETEDYTFKVVSPVTCYVPTGLTSTAVTTTTANLSWVAPTTAPVPSGYEYAVTSSATPPASGTAITGTSVTGYSGLVLNNTYYLHVRSNCGASGYSDWSTYQFIHGYCAAGSTYTGYYISSFSTTGGTANISNTGTTLSTGGYSYNGAMAVSQSEGNSVTASVTVAGSTLGVNIWVDWNDDLTFSDSEKVYASGAYISSASPSFSVPLGAIVGNHRMRVRADDLSTNPVACGTISYGETEDYTFTVLPAPPRITSFTPTAVCAGAGDTITITGANFTGSTAVKFNGVNAASFNVVSATSITAVVPAAATTGTIAITSPNGTGTSTGSLTVTAYPTVNDITGGGVSVCMPNTLQLSDTTTGGTWSSSDTNIATVSSTGLVTPVAAGTVTISYSKATSGCTTTKTTTVTFNQPVNITIQPASETVTPNSTLAFSVTATGTGLTYQWEVSTDGGTVFTPVTDGVVYDGATTATLTINEAASGMDMYRYHVIVSGASPCGAVTSGTATLSISDIGITSQPSNATICDSGAGTASFSITTTGTNLTFEWQQDAGTGTWLPLSNGTTGGVTYSGADTNTLSLSGLTAANNAFRYRAFVQDGGATALSNPATLTVNSAVVINTQPSDQVTCSTGATRNFTVAATGTGLTYQWQYATSAGGSYSNVTNATPLGVTYAGATTNSLAVTNATNTPTAPTYYYRVVITGTAPCSPVTSNPAGLTINAPTISTAPAAASVIRTNSTTFSVTTAAPSPTYQWQFSTTSGGTYTDVADSTPAGTTYSGAQSATLTVNANTTAAGSGYYYRVVVTSGGCTVTSAGAQLTVTDYCVGIVQNSGTADYMTSVSVATTTLNSTPGAVGNAANNFYALLTGSANTATFQQAHAYTATVGVVSGNANPEGVGIWIDFNNDGDFADTNEFLGAASIAGGATGTITMNIPGNATAGTRRMRVRNVRNTTMTQGTVCTAYARGTTVDYLVTIAVPTAPAITSFTPSSYCADSGVITITGTELIGGALTIGGTAVTPVVVNAAGTQLTATVNAGISGAVVVTTPGGTATSSSFSVTAPPALTLSATTGTICAGDSSNVITLTAGGSSYDVFTVTSVPAGAPYSGTSSTGYTFSPTVNTVYTIAGTQTGGGTCARSATFTATVKSNPVFPVTPATAEMCSGQIQALTVTGTMIGTAVLGTGTTVSGNTDTARPNPLSAYYGGQKAQMMFKASELTAMSMQAGTQISAVTFNLGTYTANACTDFTIRMGTVASTTTDLTGFVSGTSAVYGPATFTPSATGLVTFTLTTPFTWDGTSNLIVETVHNAGNSGNGSGSNTVYSTTAFNSSYFRMQDTVSGGIAGMDTATGGVAAAAASRPNMTFAFTTPATAVWTPATGLYTDASATVAYTAGSSVKTVYAKPGTTTTYVTSTNNGNGCSSSSSAVITVNPKSWIGGTSTDWNDPANWCGGQVPTALDNVVIAAVTNQPMVSGNVTVVGSTLTVNDGATLTVEGGSVLNITNAVTVEDEGSLVLENYAHLLQGSSVTTNPNSGNIDVFRLSSPMYRLDYTMWSSPVENQKLKAFSPETLNNRFYIYNELTDEYATITDPVNTNMAEGRGYLIRVENTHPAYNATTNAPGTPWQGEFFGKPRSGNIDVPMSLTLNGYNAVGNPYPSPINIHAFYAANTNTIADGSALYFWRKKNDADTGSYARVTKLAYTANTGNAWGDTGGTAFNGAPNTWVINPGQGFIVQATGGTLHFNNAMRVGLNNQQFFRTAQDENEAVISRLWLNLTGAEGQFAQAAIGYTDMTTMGIDYGWDGKAFVNDGNSSLFSLAGEETLGIQARSEFDPADVVPMGFRADTPGTYTITLDHMDGVFSGDQDIFLKDNLLGGLTHDLKAGNYTFETEAGLFTSRFEVVYAEALGTHNPVLDANNVIVYKQGTSININAGVLEMSEVTIYDTRGRILYSKDGINATETVISNLHSDQQVLIIQINTDKGRVTKRIIY